jgi:hypothetical protein
MILAASVGLSTRQGLWCTTNIGQLHDNGVVYAYLEAAPGTVERGEVVGLTISHNWHTQRFLRRQVSLVSNIREQRG